MSISLRSRRKIYRLGQKRLCAVLQRLTLRLRITVGGNHDYRNVGPQRLRLWQQLKPLIPGMLMSERIKMSETSPASVMR